MSALNPNGSQFGTLAALAASTVVVIGTLALTGRVTYPVELSLGPFSVHDGVSMPVAYGDEVCQKASVADTLEQHAASDCLRFFVHGPKANSAAGDVFSARAVRYVQGIGWLLILGSVTASLGLLVSTTGGYNVEMFGAGPAHRLPALTQQPASRARRIPLA